ncbi:MAG: carboxypeptidase regulatory-like domain-containing protein [Acidobacteria bacterium]|nr:carboxypeptidase regulatory-like domain-containing protein [Acidobacteriota bacterium]
MKNRIKSLIAGTVLGWVVLLATSQAVLAQSDNAVITGFVKDAAGAVIAGAKVTIKNEVRAFERVTTTNSEGYYVVSNLPSGLYTVTVEASGFKASKETGRKLDPNLTTSVDITLQPGQVTETVTIEASTTQVQTESATVGKLVETKQVEYLQLNGRNPLFLAQLKPGVQGNALGGNSFGLTTGSLVINGARTQDTLVTYDGAVGVRTRSNGTSIGTADVEATQEVQILTANYNAEYGRSSGGQVRIVTRSGGKDFHGAFYEYLRNAALNANEWGRNRNTPANAPCSDPKFEKASHCRPNPFRYNQFGYSLSGPVIIPGTGFNESRSKLFWLWGQEWVRQRRTDNTTQRVATAKMRNGDFSELADPNNALKVVRYIKDPLLSGNCNATDQTACFKDGGILNKIPANRLSPNGLAFLRAQPDPIPGFFTSSGQNFFQDRPTTDDQRKDTLSLDFYPNERHAIKYRLSLYHYVGVSAFRSGTDRAPQIIDRPNQTTSIGWTWTVSPNWISETLVAGSRDQVFIAVDTRGNAYQRSKYGINYPYIFPDNKEIFDKIPTIDGVDQFVTLDGGPYPSSSTGPIYQFSNNWTNIRGNHTFKFGGYFERAGQNDFDQINVSGTPGGTNNQNGRFVFSNSTPNATGVAIGNVALGLFDTYAEIGKRSFTPYRGHMFEWFIQDSWKATPKLRIEYGIRHSIIQPYYSLWRNMVIFDPKFYDASKAVTQDPKTGFITSNPNDLIARYNGLVIPGNDWPDAAKGPGRVPIANTGEFDFLFRGVGKSYSEIHKSNFQPRAGIAYALTDKSVIRAGVGRFMTRLGVSDSVFLGGNPPLQPTVSVSRGSADNPGGTTGNAFPLVVTSQDPIFPNPESWTWNATYEREIGFDTLIEVGYVGRRGLHAQRERNINQLQPGTIQANSGVNPDYLRPFKGFGIIRVTNNDATSRYNGLQIGANRRFTKGFLFGAAYTLSKSSDDGSAQRDVVPNAFDVGNLWGPSTFDRRHVLVVNAVYQLPIFRDKSTLMGKVFGGWTVSAISQWQTGTPITIATGDDFAGVGPGSGSQFWLYSSVPNIEGNFANNAADASYWFNPRGSNGAAIFTQPAAGTFSSQNARGILYNPGFQNHNFTLFKEFYLSENHRIQFRAEAYNWPNHPNLNGADTNPRSSTFGKVTSKSGNRELQFALRYSF